MGMLLIKILETQLLLENGLPRSSRWSSMGMLLIKNQENNFCCRKDYRSSCGDPPWECC